MSNSGKKKLLLITIMASALVVAAMIGVVFGAKNKKPRVQHNFFTVEKLVNLPTGRHLNKRETATVHDCMELINQTLDKLHETLEDLDEYPNKKPIKQHADDLITLLSPAMIDQDTCIDGLSHEGADKRVHAVLFPGLVHVDRMCSNVLAMIKNMTDTDIANHELLMARKTDHRKLKEECFHSGEDHSNDDDEGGIKWPKWMRAGGQEGVAGGEADSGRDGGGGRELEVQEDTGSSGCSTREEQ